jgi:hypothetical protein
VGVCVQTGGARLGAGREGGRGVVWGGRGVVFSQFLKILCEVPPPGPEGGTRARFAKTRGVPGKEGGGGPKARAWADGDFDADHGFAFDSVSRPAH